MDTDSSDSSPQSPKIDSDDSNLSNGSTVYSEDELDMLEHDSYKSYSEDNSVTDYDNSDEDNSMLEENNNDPNNNMDNENLEGQNQRHRAPSPQPGCSRHFDSVENGHTNSLSSKLTAEQINAIASNILQAITKLLETINHNSIVEAIQTNLRSGNNKLSLQDIIPGDFNIEANRKRRHGEDTLDVDMKRIRTNGDSPVLAGFLAGNPININYFPSVPVQAKPQESGDVKNKNQNPPVNVDEAVPVISRLTVNDKHSTYAIRKSHVLGHKSKPFSVDGHRTAQATTRFTVDPMELPKRPPPHIPATITSKSYQNEVLPPAIPLPPVLIPIPKNIKLPTSSSTGTIKKVTPIPVNNNNSREENPSDYFTQLRKMKEKLAADKREQIQNRKKYNHDVLMETANALQALETRREFENLLDKLDDNPFDNQVPAELIDIDNVVPFNNQNQMKPNASNSNNKVCEEIYQKLRAMFPDIDREYIKTFCPADWAPEPSHDIQFGNIVERILQSEASWVYDVQPNNFQADVKEDDGLTGNVDDTYEYLTGIFPNADPHYLRNAAEGFKNENDVETFVNEKLRSNDYPTREQYLAKIKVTEEQQRYTKNFNVEQFLSLIPDPFKHFEDDQRKCEFNLIVVEFLKNEFSRVRVNTISKIYRRCSYNMSLSAKQLRQSTDFIVTRRRTSEIPTENISLLQEMAFVRHHDEICKHMEAVKKREEEEFNSLKEAGSLWTCQCCYDDECMPSKCSTCDNDHIFCNSCLINGTDSKLGDGETHVPCFLNCGSEFSISTLQQVLPPTKFSILLKKRQAAEVMAAGLEGLVSCPFCHFASIPPEGDKVFKCLNPECMKESCILCQEPNHVPYKCGELDKKDKARKYIEEKMTEALTRTCYQCKRAFFKEEGCNKMTCPCGAMMCYICNEPVQNYSHFRGQGSNETDKCPLWSDNMRLNAETVRKVEEDARREILRQDPTLDIGTTGLAPALPPPTAGPHRDIPETQNLADVLAARVLNNGRLNL